MSVCFTNGQITLNANGPGSTYEDINAVLAPNYNVIEVPDCVHTSFGRHIDEVYDADLNSYVFRFYAHVTPDNDRCINFDRQRTEIKTYNQSPDELKATYGETIRYKWLFKLPAGFQSSSAFTHIHQIKSVEGPFASMPMFTLTTRKGNLSNPDRLQIRYAPEDTQTTIFQTPLAPFIDVWIEATEIIHFNDSGSYTLQLKRVSDNFMLLNYNNNIDTWQDGSTFARPKWGIYRSLNFPDDLRDEQVLFNSFSIEENPNLSIADDINIFQKTIYLSQNPASDEVFLINADKNSYERIEVYDTTGKKIMSELRNTVHSINISTLKPGLYYVVLVNRGFRNITLKCSKL